MIKLFIGRTFYFLTLSLLIGVGPNRYCLLNVKCFLVEFFTSSYTYYSNKNFYVCPLLHQFAFKLSKSRVKLHQTLAHPVLNIQLERCLLLMSFSFL